MRDWKHVSVNAGIDIYFCDPHSPWGSATRTRTSTACYVSTSPRAPTSASTATRTWIGSPSNSTTDPHAND